MAQTLGSQVLGEWYDIIGWVAGSGMFFYWAFAAQNLTNQQREKLPGWILNKTLCIVIAVLMALAAIGKALW